MVTQIPQLRIGFIGLGLMGKPMAGHLLERRLPAHRPQSQPRRRR